MIFINKYDRSVLNKTVFSGCILFATLTSVWLLIANDATSSTWLQQYQLSGNLARRMLIAACLMVYFLRLQVTVWVFQKRKWTWLETLLITVLMVFVLYSFAKSGGSNTQVVGVVEITGILLYLSGSYINTHSEYARHVWKLKEENQGRLYTGGVFGLSMHINYFGDIVLFMGFAMVTHCPRMLIIPVVMALNFIFFIIPSLDRYLAQKYKDEFGDYARKTKKIVPFIY